MRQSRLVVVALMAVVVLSDPALAQSVHAGVSANDGKRDLVNCGPGREWFTTDSLDVVRNCEVPAIT